ncbi:hypothetical+protein [Methylocapsa aurea]
MIIFRWREKTVCILETALLDTIHPDNKSFSEGLPGFGCRADEISNRDGTRIHYAIAKPAHSPRLLNTVFE